MLKIAFVLLSVFAAIQCSEIDPKGYLIFCPCMGRFGNQVDQLLGVMSFAKQLDRTLVLPNFIEYKRALANMVPFENLFQLGTIKKYQRAVTMSEFVHKIMPTLWPPEKRTVLCWNPRESVYDKSAPPSCQAKEGNPFGPYWDKIGVNFVGDEYFGTIPGGYDLMAGGSKDAWMANFSPQTHPVLAFSSAPAIFPSKSRHWPMQQHLKWNSRIVTEAKEFIANTLERPFVGIHLRNDDDWKRVCEHVNEERKGALFASAQCLGEYQQEGDLTREICAPSKNIIIEDIITQVGAIGARSVFVASDKNHMIDEINEALNAYGIKAHRMEPDDPYVSLSILAQSDHFIGSCVSTFSHIVRRERDYGKTKRTTTYFGMRPKKPKFEL